MLIKSDISELSNITMKMEGVLAYMPDEIQKLLFQGAADVVVIVVHRIRTQGEDADGGTLITRSSMPYGRYSQRHGRARNEKGLQVARVDLTFTGEMLRDYNITEREPNQVGVGFVNDESHEKAEELEKYYNAPVFVPSLSEEDEVVNDLEESIFNLIDAL